jgi:hypothetical protein
MVYPVLRRPSLDGIEIRDVQLAGPEHRHVRLGERQRIAKRRSECRLDGLVARSIASYSVHSLSRTEIDYRYNAHRLNLRSCSTS